MISNHLKESFFAAQTRFLAIQSNVIKGASRIRSLHNNILVHNVVFLYMVQFAQYLIPLVTIPYLLRVLGPSGFGSVAFAQSLLSYFVLTTEFGFNFSATRRISLASTNHEEVSWIVSHVWAIKAGLCILGFIILLTLTYNLPVLREQRELLTILYGTVLGQAILPLWLYQGMQKLKDVSIINVVVQVLITVCIFLFIRKSTDYVLYATILSVGSLVGGAIGAIVAFRIVRLDLQLPTVSGIKELFVESYPLFVSMASISLYTIGNPFILGLFTNPLVVGYYSAAERLAKTAVFMIDPINQALYPRMNRVVKNSSESLLLWFRYLLLLFGGLGLLLSITLFFSAPTIVKVLLGPEFEPSIIILQIMSTLPFFVAISNLLGIHVLFSFKLENAVTRIVLIAGILNFIMAVLFVPLWQSTGMAIAFIVSEVFVTAGYTLYLYHNRTRIFAPLLLVEK